MTQVAEKVKAEIMQLPSVDRAELARLLILSLEATVDEDAESAWDQELDRRLRRIEQGKSKGRPTEDVLAEIRNKYQ